MSDAVVEVGPHRLYRGRCEDWLDELPEASVDVVVTSPPYNLGISYPSHQDNMSEGAYLTWLCQVARRLARVLKPDGSFFLNLGGSNTRPWLPFAAPNRLREMVDYGQRPLWVLQNHITWIKSVAINERTVGQCKPIRSRRYLTHTHELLLHLTRTGEVPIDRLAIGVPYADRSNIARFGAPGRPDLRCRGNVWFIPYDTVQSKAEKWNHPASFPTKLPQWAIRLHGVTDPVVLDPFCGTGTTLVAAGLEGGRGIGIELDAGYHATAVGRLRATLEQAA